MVRAKSGLGLLDRAFRRGEGMNDESGSDAPIQGALLPRAIDELLKPEKTIRLAVTGDVPITRLERKIIDTPAFQRLRTIKQLGTTYLVYPTAVHTRFDHSLGTLAVALGMMSAIRSNRHSATRETIIEPEQEILVRLLALLHDISHIPFGHILEDEFSVLPRHDLDPVRTEYFLGDASDIGKVLIRYLGRSLYDRFIRIYKTPKADVASLGDDAFVYDLISNTVCADLLDYLRRDCFFANIALDTDFRFLNYLYLDEQDGARRVVVRLWKGKKATPRRDTLSELVRLLDNRYLLGERVYFHHTKLVTGAMVAGAVVRALEKRKLRKEQLYELGDDVLLDRLEQCKVAGVTSLISSLRRRQLWKPVDFEVGRSQIEAEQGSLRDRPPINEVITTEWWREARLRATEEDRVAGLLGMGSGDLLIYCPDPEMSLKLAEMQVFWNGRVRPLMDCEDDPIVGEKLNVILKSHKNLWALRAFMNPTQRRQEEIIQDACKAWFTFSPGQKEKHEKHFYRGVVQTTAEVNEWGNSLGHSEYERRTVDAVERLMSHTATTRDRSAIEEIVRGAFGVA